MTVSVPIAHPPIRRRAWLPYLAGFLVIWGALHATASLEATGNLGLVILAVTPSAAALVEVFVYRTPTVHVVLSLLGFGRPRGRTLLVAAAVSAVILGVVPLFTLVTGQSLGLRSNWPWLLIGIFAFHGLAGELTWRADDLGAGAGSHGNRQLQARDRYGFRDGDVLTPVIAVSLVVPMLVFAFPRRFLGAGADHAGLPARPPESTKGAPRGALRRQR